MTSQPGEKPDKQQRHPKRSKYGEGSVFYREDRNQWVAQIRLENGKKKQFYFEKEKDAQRGLRHALFELEQGTLATGPQQTLKTYLEQWFEQVHKLQVRESTYKMNKVLLETHIIPALGHVKVKSLTAQRVQALYAAKQDEELSAGYIRIMHALLHKALENAVRWRLISINVCDDVTPPRVGKRDVHPLSIEQIRSLLITAKGHALETFLTVAITTGMRHGELVGLRWQDINFEEGSLFVHRTVQYTRNRFQESEPKTPQSRRRILLSPFVLVKLHEHRAAQEQHRIKAGSMWRNRGLVFCNKEGEFLYPGPLMKQFHALLARAGLPPMHIHDLRHSAATVLLSKGVNPKQVQELLGHSQINMTIGKYGHVLPSMQKEIADKFDDLLS